MTGARRIEKLGPGHDLQGFDCGQEDLNRWFKKFALQAQLANSARTYVGLEGDTVIGFYSLVYSQVEYEGAPARLKKGVPRQPVPVMLLARLAVHRDWQRRGVGRAFLRDAVLRTLQAADIAGLRALLIHAKNDEAKRFYRQFDFTESPTDPLHLCALLKDLKHLVDQP